jgi:membrane-associated phospholipid phosphatase
VGDRASRPLVAIVVLLCSGARIGAQSEVPRYDAAWHGSLAAGAFIGASLLVRWERGQPLECRWCGRAADGSPAAPRLDEWARTTLRWQHERRAASLSHVTATASYAWPLVALTAVHGGTGGEWGRDQLAVASSLGLAQLGADVTKRAVRRARPGVVFEGDGIASRDDAHSFISGHTATTFAAVVAAGTIASRRHSPDATWIWVSGLGMAATTGYLRVAADRHFVTDVLGGAAVGTAIGMLMPRVFDEYGARGGPVPDASRLVGLGPVVRLTASRSTPVTIRLGAGGRSLGLVGTVGIE